MYFLHENINFNLVYSNTKSIRISFSPTNNAITIVSPKNYKLKTIKNIISQKIDWIKEKQSETGYHFINYIDGEEHLLFGKKYILQIKSLNNSNENKNSLKIENENFILTQKTELDYYKKEALFEKFYKEELMLILSIIVKKYEYILNVNVNSFKIKKMRTKWGSCNITNSNIWLNLMLAKKSIACIELVVLHEIIHFFEKNHNARFYNYLDKYLPDWRKTAEELR